MTDTVRPVFHGFEQIPLREYAERAYLDYSMYVVLDRALPFLGDGLKPVQRRIIFAMSELGLNAGAKPKKSARTVGDVIGKYHPHGDSACYEALVLMAQPFSYRYPLIEGQGNFGSSDDPKSFAAMRYTESKLTPIAEVLLGELGQGTVDWTPEFRRHPGRTDLDAGAPAAPAAQRHHRHRGRHGDRRAAAQPQRDRQRLRAPARRSRRHACATCASTCAGRTTRPKPRSSPPPADLLAMYETGLGSVRARATFAREGANMVITALPYQVSPSKVIEQIATADAREETAVAGRPARRIRPRQSRPAS